MGNLNGICRTALLTLALVAATTGMAMATSPEQFGTPDNLPPPLEEVCDMTSGAAHGLCVAFCEAMDCDNDNANASATACLRVAERYIRLTGEQPPCIRTCPCWEESALNSVTAENQYPVFSCVSGEGGFAVVIQNFPGSTPGVEGGFAAGFVAPEVGACLTRDLPPFFLQITADEVQACEDQIRDRCAAIGTPIP